MRFLLAASYLFVLHHSILAMSMPQIDGALVSKLMADRLTKVFLDKEPFSVYPSGSVSVICRQLPLDNPGVNFAIIKCYADVDSDELQMSGTLASFLVARSKQDLPDSLDKGALPPLGDYPCLRSLLADPECDGQGLPFSPFHSANNNINLYSTTEPVERFSSALVGHSVIQAFEANARLFYYLLADKRLADAQGPGLHFMPAVCTEALLNGQLPIVPAESTSDSLPALLEMTQPVLISLEAAILSLQELAAGHQQRTGTKALLSELTVRRILSFDTNCADSLDLIGGLKSLAKIVQDMSHMGPSCGNVIDASNILPLITQSPTVPQTAGAHKNYLCRRMLHSGRVWFAMRNVEVGYTGPSTKGFEAFDIKDNPRLRYIKFRMDESARGFYFLIIFEI